jgi:type I restriction enzyme S subunit
MSTATMKTAVAPLRRTKPYPAYKDSDIEWLGKIPAQWKVAPLFTLARERSTRNIKGEEMNVLSLSYGRIVRRDISENFGLMPESFETYQIVEPGNLVLRLTDLQNDKRSLRVGFVTERGIITSAYVALRISSNLAPEYAAYLLHAYDVTKVFYALGGGVRQTMKFEDLKWMPLLVPSAGEQRAITAFLDRETARIDVLLTKKQRLIELLEAERAGLITRAVTRGLDANVPLKDSGIDWLGRIPVHWEIVRLGHFSAIGNGSTPSRDEPLYWVDGTYPWLTSGKINEEIISSANEFVTPRTLRECHLPRIPAGSLLVAITGEGQTRGRAALLQIESTISQHLAYVTPRGPRLNANYLRRVFQSCYDWLRAESSGSGSTRAALTCDFLKSIRVAIPPSAEQHAVVALLDRETARIDALVAKVHDGIQRLQELRTTLVSAAVTGKIDVREEIS